MVDGSYHKTCIITHFADIPASNPSFRYKLEQENSVILRIMKRGAPGTHLHDEWEDDCCRYRLS